MTHYPASDYPYTFYYNGAALPKWAACWSLCSLEDFITEGGLPHHLAHDLWSISCRIDHTGTIESEDPLVMLAALHQIAIILASNKEKIQHNIATSCTHLTDTPETIFYGLLDGVVSMISLTQTHQHALWTSGYAADQDKLNTFITRTKLPPDHADHLEQPHLTQQKRDYLATTRQHLTTLRKLAQSGSLEKNQHRLIHQIEDTTI